MINKRLIGMVSDSKKQIARNVAFQWVALVANITLILTVARYLAQLAEGKSASLAGTLLIAAAAILVRFLRQASNPMQLPCIAQRKAGIAKSNF